MLHKDLLEYIINLNQILQTKYVVKKYENTATSESASDSIEALITQVEIQKNNEKKVDQPQKPRFVVASEESLVMTNQHADQLQTSGQRPECENPSDFIQKFITEEMANAYKAQLIPKIFDACYEYYMRSHNDTCPFKMLPYSIDKLNIHFHLLSINLSNEINKIFISLINSEKYGRFRIQKPPIHLRIEPREVKKQAELFANMANELVKIFTDKN